jgi:mannose-6-phosphate isomerase
MTIYPLKFKPVYVDKIWGGNKLCTQYNRELLSNKVGESWEISAQENGLSYVENGPQQGKTIQMMVDEWGEALLGTIVQQKQFPLLVKIIDAQDVLSVQVHPNAQAVARYGGATKTEMWVVLHAEPGAALYCGLTEGTDESILRQAIEAGECEKYLNKIEVKAGDSVFIPVGTVHAIGAGLLLYEIQETSDTTYRLYDWNRVGDDGKPRQLHLEESFATIDYQASQSLINGLTIKTNDYERTILVSCPYFTCEKVKITQGAEWETTQESFEVLTITKGDAVLYYGTHQLVVEQGRSVLIPAALGKYVIVGDVEYLRGYIADREKRVLQPLIDQGYEKENIDNQIKGY